VPDVHLLDGTYELFRHFFGAPARTAPDGRDVGATAGVLRSVLGLIAGEHVTHLGAATDHVIESFRNDLYPGYKTGAGIEPALLGQFQLVEDGLRAAGVLVWAMVDHEADDALATAAARADADPRVGRVFILSPDKDLAQCVRGERVVTVDRLRNKTRDEAGVRAKFGVPPAAIADWLALVGDSADGYPGIPGFGAKTAAAVLARFGSIDAIPADPRAWGDLRGAKGLAAALGERRAEAALYRRLATLVSDAPIPCALEDLEWKGVPRAAFTAFCQENGLGDLLSRVPRWAGA